MFILVRFYAFCYDPMNVALSDLNIHYFFSFYSSSTDIFDWVQVRTLVQEDAPVEPVLRTLVLLEA